MAPEDPAYLTEQLITAIGNKRALLGPIGAAIAHVRDRLGGRRLRAFDAFSGSGVVSRLLKAHCDLLVCNDLEDYARAASECFLRNRSTVDGAALAAAVDDLNAHALDDGPPGFIEELYAPRDDDAIQPGERVFYTRQNARRLDNMRRRLEAHPRDLAPLLLGPLLSEASIHANTAGVFKGFYKDRHSRVGRFGGTRGDALTRILGPIALRPPALSRHECAVRVLQQDANAAARRLRDLDLAYLDPPYNQHPYGSNYFMLNLLTRYERPARVSAVSGIPPDWRRSGYNVRAQSGSLLADLVGALDARFVLVSYSDEGFIRPEEMRSLLAPLGKVEAFEIPYNAFRGARNLRNRRLHVKESLFLVEKR